MKKESLKMLGLGFVAGAVCMVTTTALAEALTVSAVVPGDITFKFNGTNVAANANSPALNYKDSVYVPIRFVAEQLGCSVQFDPVMRQVVVTSPEPEVIEKIVEKGVEKIVYVDKSEDPNNTDYVYSKLPAVYEASDYRLTVTGLYSKISDENSGNYGANDYTKIFLTLENKGNQYNLQLVQGSAELIADDKEYPLSPFRNLWDQEWYNDIKTKKDNNIHDGYLVFEPVPKDAQKYTLKLKIWRQGATGDNKEETVEFHFLKP